MISTSKFTKKACVNQEFHIIYLKEATVFFVFACFVFLNPFDLSSAL